MLLDRIHAVCPDRIGHGVGLLGLTQDRIEQFSGLRIRVTGLNDGERPKVRGRDILRGETAENLICGRKVFGCRHSESPSGGSIASRPFRHHQDEAA